MLAFWIRGLAYFILAIQFIEKPHTSFKNVLMKGMSARNH